MFFWGKVNVPAVHPDLTVGDNLHISPAMLLLDVTINYGGIALEGLFYFRITLGAIISQIWDSYR